jgi:cellulose synthase/poly-beta-1,6-N-acetylglucosamine synthase-like glycosyltransferase
MIEFSLPKWVHSILQKPLNINKYTPEEIAQLQQKLQKFSVNDPLVSVVIPAWNEEEGILHTLHSLANTTTQYQTELIVIDNNSTDGTNALLQKLGVKTIIEKKQGVGNARTCGLHQARGKYILTGDSDTLYPPGWITAMTKTLIDGEKQATPVYCVHGTYSFLPSDSTPRWQYALYEVMSSYVIKKKEKAQPFLNTLGFNTGFVKQKGIEVNGYDIETQRTFRGQAGVLETNATEDGMMALRLQEAGGKNQAELTKDGRVWTSDRRIQMDGGLKNALSMRLKKHLFKK